MKRSEMIKIIRTVIKLNHAEDAYSFQRGEISLGALADRLAPSLLVRMENEGMLPPISNLSNFQIKDNAWESED